MKKKNDKVKGLRMGYVKFSGLGGYRGDMLSELLEDGVPVRNITVSDEEISGAVSPTDYFRVSETARRHGVRIKAGERRGLYFTLRKYRTRAGLCVGALLFILVIALWQTSVRSITIEGDAPRSQIMQILDECRIRLGASTDTLEISKAEHRILAEVEKPEMEENAPRNITAARSAKIVRQIPRMGASVVENGSGVNAGDLLVSGTVPDGRDHVMFVRADAEIIGEWTETREFFVPYNETISLANGEKKVFKYLVYGDDVQDKIRHLHRLYLARHNKKPRRCFVGASKTKA